jgi:hypothetical protein
VMDWWPSCASIGQLMTELWARVFQRIMLSCIHVRAWKKNAEHTSWIDRPKNGRRDPLYSGRCNTKLHHTSLLLLRKCGLAKMLSCTVYAQSWLERDRVC